MLTRLSQLLPQTDLQRSAVGAFNASTLEHIEAIVAGAELVGLPVIVQISQNAARSHGGLKPMAVAARSIGEAATVPVALHLDHAEDLELIDEAIALGFGSVMFDGSRLSHSDNIMQTQSVVERAHASGVDVEAELGEIGGKDGVHAPTSRTDPDEARHFAESTGVDALAIAIGTSHAMTKREAELDLDLLCHIREQVRIPLVLHGSSGVSDLILIRAIGAGIQKINVATHVNGIFTETIRRALSDAPGIVDSRKYLGPARTAMSSEVARLLTLFSLRTVATPPDSRER